MPTPIKAYRIPTDLQAAIEAEARRAGTTNSEVVRKVLRKALRPTITAPMGKEKQND